MTEAKHPTATQPAAITTEQLQAWIIRREKFRSRIKTLVIFVLVISIGGIVTIWTLFHDQLIARAALSSLGFNVSWDLDYTNIWHSGETSVSFSQRWYHTDRIGRQEMQALKKLLHLQSLDLSSLDWLRDDDLAFLADLKELTDLQISRSGQSNLKEKPIPLTDEVIEHIKGLTRLKSLSLADNRISDAGVAKLANLGELESLDLDNTRITNASFETFKTMKKLKFLRVVGTKVTRAGVAAFQKVMPNTEVANENDVIGPEN